jgi:hypothetical protein
MSTCDNFIKKAIERNCDEPFVGGLELVGYIGNRAQIDFANVEFKAGSKHEISAFPLIAGAKIFPVYQTGKRPFTGSTKTLNASDLGGYVTNRVQFIILDNSPEVSANIIDPILDGEFFFIHENRAKHLKDENNAGNSAFEIKGFYQGLTLAEGSLDPYSDDTNGGWSIALEEEKAPTSGLFLNAGTYSATKTLISTLVNGQ